MLAHHHVMKTRDNMSAVIEGLQRDHGLLAAYLEATDKIDWRADRGFRHSSSRGFGIGYLIAEPEGPSFISSTVARSRVDRLRS